MRQQTSETMLEKRLQEQMLSNHILRDPLSFSLLFLSFPNARNERRKKGRLSLSWQTGSPRGKKQNRIDDWKHQGAKSKKRQHPSKLWNAYGFKQLWLSTFQAISWWQGVRRKLPRDYKFLGLKSPEAWQTYHKGLPRQYSMKGVYPQVCLGNCTTNTANQQIQQKR